MKINTYVKYNICILKTYLGCFGGVGLGLWYVLLLKVLGSILLRVNLGDLNNFGVKVNMFFHKIVYYY